MCGITGIIANNSNFISKQRLIKMTDALAHRGPDGEGFWINHSQQVALGHRRLSIIDLSEHAAQPMHYQQRYTITHNGEIYNYLELKKDLQSKGYSFRTASDTEVILAAYDHYRQDCLSYLEGMFAFAIWDEKEQILFCARDRFGEKPFFYSFDDDQFLFASEAKALWSAGIEKKVNEPLLLNYLALGHTQTPVDKTICFYQDVFSLPPAHFLTLKLADLSFVLQQYWDCDKEMQVGISEYHAIERFQSLFMTSLKRRLRSDVNIGTSLSGGLDSSSIAASIKKLNDNRFSQKTFSATFPGFEKDESSYIRQIVQSNQLENYTVSPTADDLIRDFEKLCRHQEMPFTSSSIYAQFKVFELANQNDIKVLIDGQGADEILAGYSRYIHWYLQEMLRTKPSEAIKEFRALKKNHVHFDQSWKNYFAAFFPAQTAHQLEKREIKKIFNHPDINTDFKQQFFDRPSIYKPLVTKLNDILYFNTCHQGLEELLRFADRNSMAHGIEVRLPFLSHELVQYIFSLPAQLKIHEGWTKYILRRAMQQWLPEKITWRRDKTGFEPPQSTWMENKSVQEYIFEAKRILVEKRILKPDVLNKKNQPLDAHAADNFDWRYLVAARLIH